MGKMFDALQKAEQEKERLPDTPSLKVASENRVLDSKLISHFEPSSIVAEQFRRLRTFIVKPGQGNAAKTFLVTSAMEGEGKSLIAINLAITIAIELHSNALLVDCDLRNPSLSRWFGFESEKGLSNYLVGEAELPELLVKTSVDKLSLLPGGTLQHNPVELVGSNRMKALVEDLRSRYDDRYIIFDSSPLLATTEPSVLNEMVDGILLVIKSGATPREAILQAIRLLDKKKILGVVLNNLEFKTGSMHRRYFGTHQHYYYNHHSGSQKFDDTKHVAARIRNMKMFLRNFRFKKKKEVF